MNNFTPCTDSHAHLTSETLFPQVDDILQRAQAAGVNTIVNICTNSDELAKGIELTSRYPWIYNAGATTPHDVEKDGEREFSIFAQAAKKGRLIAIGETGLDYHYEHSNRDIQKDFLRRYLHLALQTSLPVIIHCRDAFADFFEILDQEYSFNNCHAPGVLHCFTGTFSEAEEVLKRGWFLSLSGIVTFKKSLALHEIAKKIPLDYLLIETDAPYLAPQSHRGKPNEPAYIIETAALIAKLKEIKTEDVIQASNANAKRLFKF